ncbi:hypothetical protein CANCADRAFT_123311 [Tortispora caseinolytica NRRL Y-17796]|uniref:Phosphatidylglycerophosphatase GEP4, mitochondrial n=1 Tax=Tortispora caseinolytica NRRL Y-17796 TaxID=767744 RepID=A0A1E4THY8_9ASCO|nr:hypothetical protein CANCADRAFT_123311 [Tortispora caseinolytica NRRL Y-17796]
MNISGTLNFFKVLLQPSLAIPTYSVPTFDHVPSILANLPEIHALVIDKDNCFAIDGTDSVYPKYADTWKLLQTKYPNRLLIVSNSTGTRNDGRAEILESNTGAAVLRHTTKKPGCFPDILQYFSKHGINNPSSIAVIGDRVLTDVVMGNLNNAPSIWVSEGVELSNGIFQVFERWLVNYLQKKNK